MRGNTNQNNSEYGHFLCSEPSAYQNAKRHSLMSKIEDGAPSASSIIALKNFLLRHLIF